MRYAATGAPAPLLALACLAALALPRPAAADPEQDQFEEKTVARAVERAARLLKSDRATWVKELEAAFPGKVADATTEEEYAGWFRLVAGEAAEWRRAASATPQVAELFDRVVQRLELGPVPSVTRDEFARYAKRVLMREQPSAPGDAAGPAEEADKVFRVLDRDADGVLQPGEMTTRLRDDRAGADADGNGRIDKDEYRRFFARRVTAAVETAAKAGDKDGKGADPKAGDRDKAAAAPGWFAELDGDKDGQVALHEWRKARRAVATFLEMDLNGDGLLTREEFLRYQQTKEKPRPDPPPPG